jgi:hypothetical protein
MKPQSYAKNKIATYLNNNISLCINLTTIHQNNLYKLIDYS